MEKKFYRKELITNERKSISDLKTRGGKSPHFTDRHMTELMTVSHKTPVYEYYVSHFKHETTQWTKSSTR